MSHIAEEYAKNLGVKIGKPEISEHYFPAPAKKYIVLHAEQDVQSKSYRHYDLVLSMVKPVLQMEGISIVQIDVRQDRPFVEGVDHVVGGLTMKQYAYVIRKSMMYVGTNNVYMHLAALNNLPTVTMYGNVFPSVGGPIWNNKKIDIQPEWVSKPCLNVTDPLSEINKIKPETVVNGILQSLNLKHRSDIETLHVGSMFGEEVIEVVPESFMELRPKSILFLRGDYCPDFKVIEQFLKRYDCSLIINVLPEASFIKEHRHRLKKLSIMFDENTGEIEDSYIDLFKELGIDFHILVKDEKILPVLRNKYFDVKVDKYEVRSEPLPNIPDNAKFLTSKYILANGKQYPSLWHYKNKVDNSLQVEDNMDYWEESEHYYIYVNKS